jgi:hypothetical protein
VIERERVEATQGLIGIAMDLEVTSDVGARETELVGGPGDVLKAAWVLQLHDHISTEADAGPVVGLETHLALFWYHHGKCIGDLHVGPFYDLALSDNLVVQAE